MPPALAHYALVIDLAPYGHAGVAIVEILHTGDPCVIYTDGYASITDAQAALIGIPTYTLAEAAVAVPYWRTDVYDLTGFTPDDLFPRLPWMGAPHDDNLA